MFNFKKLAALLLSGAMCASLAFGAACSGSDDSGSTDGDNTNTGNTDTGSGSTDSGNTGNTGDTSDTGDTGSSGDTGDTGSTDIDFSDLILPSTTDTTEYVQAVTDTYGNVYTSANGYELSMNGSVDIVYTDDYDTNEIALSISSVALYKYIDEVLGIDQDIIISGETNYEYTYGDIPESGSQSIGAVLSTRVRGSDIYCGYAYSDAAYTSVPDDMLYASISVEGIVTSLSEYLLGTTIDYESLMYIISSYTEDISDEQLASVEGLVYSLVDNPIITAYAKTTTTESGTTLSYDFVKSAKYVLNCAKLMVSLIQEGTTIEDLAQNYMVALAMNNLLGDITASDIYEVVDMVAQFFMSGESTLPAVTEGQSAFDYLLTLYQYALTASGSTSPDLSEYKETATEVINECLSVVSVFNDLSLELYFDGDLNYTGYALSIDLDGGEIIGLDLQLQLGMTLTEKDVTLATIDESNVYVYSGYAEYGEDYDTADVYFMADGTVMLGLYDEEYNVTYVNTGLQYTVDTNGDIATIDGSGAEVAYEGEYLSQYYIYFTYNGVTYAYYFYVYYY